MNLGNYIDIIIITLCAFNILMGIKNGFVKALFISFGFVIKLILTYLVYSGFSKMILSNQIVQNIIGFIRQFIVMHAPVLETVSEQVDHIILVILIFILSSIIVMIVFKLLTDMTDTEALKLSDHILGGLYGLLKSVLFLMILVYALDKVVDYTLTSQVKEALSESTLLAPFYTYNIFMNLFNF